MCEGEGRRTAAVSGLLTNERMGSVSSESFLFIIKSPVRFWIVTDSGAAMLRGVATYKV